MIRNTDTQNNTRKERNKFAPTGFWFLIKAEQQKRHLHVSACGGTKQDGVFSYSWSQNTFRSRWHADETVFVVKSVNVWTSERTQFLNHLLSFSAASVSCKYGSGALNPFKAVLTLAHLGRHRYVLSLCLFQSVSFFYTSFSPQLPFNPFIFLSSPILTLNWTFHFNLFLMLNLLTLGFDP